MIRFDVAIAPEPLGTGSPLMTALLFAAVAALCVLAVILIRRAIRRAKERDQSTK